jgi:hypothetical protein
LGTIFRVTFTVSYRRIWDIVGKYSILCCDRMLHSESTSGWRIWSQPYVGRNGI